MSSIFARTMRGPSLGHIRRVTPIRPAAADGDVAMLYRQVEHEFGLLAPPVALHAAAPEVLAAVWTILRETLLAGDPAARVAKEAVATAVSLANACPYCVEVHGAALAGLRADDAAGLVVAGRIDDVADPWLRRLARWARSSAERNAARRSPAPFTAEQAADFIGVAVTFHYINRMVLIFLTESPLYPVPRRGHPTARRVAARVFGRMARTSLRSGLSRELLPDAEPAADLGWAAGAAPIAEAFARACAVIDSSGAATVPTAVRELVLAGLADPTEAGPGIDAEAWLAAQVCGLRAADKPVGRLALLTAWAPYRVRDVDIDRVRAVGHADGAVIRMTAWASLAAARHVGLALHGDLAAAGG